MNKSYFVTEYRKIKVNDDYYEKKVHKCNSVKEMVELADELASAAEHDLNNGEIVDFQIEY